MIRLLPTILLAISLIACHPKGREFVKHKDLSPELEWLKKDAREFQVPVDDISITYNMSLAFRYANGFQHQFLMVKVTEISPDGAEEVKNYTLKIREENGRYIGEPGYDIWDSEHLVEEAKRYEKRGTYTYIIEHNMPVDPVNFAMEIGLILDRKE